MGNAGGKLKEFSTILERPCTASGSLLGVCLPIAQPLPNMIAWLAVSVHLVSLLFWGSPSLNAHIHV